MIFKVDKILVSQQDVVFLNIIDLLPRKPDFGNVAEYRSCRRVSGDNAIDREGHQTFLRRAESNMFRP